jgi:hypothetical protein
MVRTWERNPSLRNRQRRVNTPTRERNEADWLPKEIGLFLLSVAVILAAIFFLPQSDNNDFVDHSVWSEVYIPGMHGIGVIARKNISVRPFVSVSPIYAK